ncbi:MAG: FAD-binding oxidoreductase, partial [Silvanigrellaceae bacterium]|nr:FAD-binding oxidoreductase [Silvanigrellaceae bacterium]
MGYLMTEFTKHKSWGNSKTSLSKPIFVQWKHELLPDFNLNILPYGQARSYGDSCLNDNGILLHTKNFKRFIDFNSQLGTITCESGTTFEDILNLIVPQGWFLPVTPGTKYISVGGAIANDIHGKNHHIAGNFGHHVLKFELLRSNGERIICSPETNKDYFYATIGGLGLTGLITWVQFSLKKINNPMICQEVIKFHSLKEFLDLSCSSENDFEYTVSWIDCLAPTGNLKGLFIRGNHAPAQACIEQTKLKKN